MIKSIFCNDALTVKCGELALSSFANTMVMLTRVRETESLADYVDTVQAFLIVLCKDLAENVDVHNCLEIMHKVFMYIGTDNEKYRKEIGDIIEVIARKEKEQNE